RAGRQLRRRRWRRAPCPTAPGGGTRPHPRPALRGEGHGARAMGRAGDGGDDDEDDGGDPARAGAAVCELILDRVTDVDARAMADALQRSLDDLPDHDALAGHPRRGLSWDERYAGGPFLTNPPRLLEWFSGPNKQMVRDLIRFARRGGFRVEDP